MSVRHRTPRRERPTTNEEGRSGRTGPTCPKPRDQSPKTTAGPKGPALPALLLVRSDPTSTLQKRIVDILASPVQEEVEFRQCSRAQHAHMCVAVELAFEDRVFHIEQECGSNLACTARIHRGNSGVVSLPCGQ